MSLKIYLLRHGETEYSQRGAYCGALDAELTTEGHQMARAFADAYRSIPWTDVYVSPMKRAIATARPLCDAVGLPMQMRDGLRKSVMVLGKIVNSTMSGNTTNKTTCAGRLIRRGIRRPVVKLQFR